MIPRYIESAMRKDFGKGKALLVLGARQVGKTTLLRQLAAGVGRTVWLDCDNPDDRAVLENPNTSRLAALAAGTDLLLIDEAQRVPGIGLALKMLVDATGRTTQVVATGSSALELAGGVHESAAGRVFEYRLHPLSHGELARGSGGGAREEKRLLERRLVYGSYPEVAGASDADARRILSGIADGALYKDLFSLGGVRKPERLVRLTQCLALQIGSEMSAGELAEMTGLDRGTVETYVDLLEKTFVVFRLPSLARNARNELRKARKVYFWDNGVRNAVIGNFAPLPLRSDAGALWENRMVSERRKLADWNGLGAKGYFWRTATQSEVDYVEDGDGRLSAWEFKWGKGKKARLPGPFAAAYPGTPFGVVTPETFGSFLGLEDAWDSRGGEAGEPQS